MLAIATNNFERLSAALIGAAKELRKDMGTQSKIIMNIRTARILYSERGVFMHCFARRYLIEGISTRRPLLMLDSSLYSRVKALWVEKSCIRSSGGVGVDVQCDALGTCRTSTLYTYGGERLR